MLEATMRKRMSLGKAIQYRYHDGDRVGLVNVWRHEDRFVLTWEECLEGDQANESNYLKDDRHRFQTVDEVVDFLKRHDLPIEKFTP
jgi:hypothetical protein